MICFDLLVADSHHIRPSDLSGPSYLYLVKRITNSRHSYAKNNSAIFSKALEVMKKILQLADTYCHFIMKCGVYLSSYKKSNYIQYFKSSVIS